MKRIFVGIAILALLSLSSFCGWTVYAGLSLQPESLGSIAVLSFCLAPYIVVGVIALFVGYVLFIMTDWGWKSANRRP